MMTLDANHVFHRTSWKLAQSAHSSTEEARQAGANLLISRRHPTRD
jgi:hypothetical protein